MTLTGDLELRGADNWTDGDAGCQGATGYDDLQVGAAVTVYNSVGDYAGAGYLDSSSAKGSVCTFKYEITGIAGGSKVYLVEVSHRGKLAATKLSDTMLIAESFIGD